MTLKCFTLNLGVCLYFGYIEDRLFRPTGDVGLFIWKGGDLLTYQQNFPYFFIVEARVGMTTIVSVISQVRKRHFMGVVLLPLEGGVLCRCAITYTGYATAGLTTLRVNKK